MNANNSLADVFLIGNTARLLLCFLDKHSIAQPSLRAQIELAAQEAHIPIVTWWSLLNQIHAVHPIEGLGLEIAQCFEPSHMGVLGYLLANCDTIEQGMLRFTRYQKLMHSRAPYLFSNENGYYQYGFDKDYQPDSYLSEEVLFAGVLSFFRMMLRRQDFAPTRMVFRAPRPKDEARYTQFFGCPVLFEQSRALIEFGIEQTRIPMPNKDTQLLGILEQQAQALLHANQTQDAWLTQIQQHIVSMLHDAQLSFEILAQHIGVSERTLYRQFQERGLHYKQVLADMRYELAKDYLKDYKLSLTEIAFLLGFSEQSAFARAFKEWSGQTPLHFRKQPHH